MAIHLNSGIIVFTLCWIMFSWKTVLRGTHGTFEYTSHMSKSVTNHMEPNGWRQRHANLFWNFKMYYYLYSEIPNMVLAQSGGSTFKPTSQFKKKNCFHSGFLWTRSHMGMLFLKIKFMVAMCFSRTDRFSITTKANDLFYIIWRRKTYSWKIVACISFKQYFAYKLPLATLICVLKDTRVRF